MNPIPVFVGRNCLCVAFCAVLVSYYIGSLKKISIETFVGITVVFLYFIVYLN